MYGGGGGGGGGIIRATSMRVGEARAIRATSMSSRCPSPDEGHVFRDVGEGGVIIRASSVWEVGGGGGGSGGGVLQFQVGVPLLMVTGMWGRGESLSELVGGWWWWFGGGGGFSLGSWGWWFGGGGGVTIIRATSMRALS